MFGGYLLALPMHAGGLAVVDLHAVHAYVALAGFGIAGDDAGQCDERASILRPSGEDGQFEQVNSLPSVGDRAVDDLLAGGVSGGDDFGEEAADLGEFWKELELVEEAGGRLGVDQGADSFGDCIERIGFEGEFHAAFGAELVHQDFGARKACDVFEEKSWATSS